METSGSQKGGGGVTMPDDYYPFVLLDQMESLYRFTNRAYHGLPEYKAKVSELNKHKIKSIVRAKVDLNLIDSF